MSLRNKLIVGGCIVWTMAIGLFVVGLWATKVNDDSVNHEANAASTEPILYELPNS